MEFNFEASKAVDGNRNRDYHAGSCSHTLDNNPVWWMVDLGEDVTITNVIITSRDEGSKSERSVINWASIGKQLEALCIYIFA